MAPATRQGPPRRAPFRPWLLAGMAVAVGVLAAVAAGPYFASLGPTRPPVNPPADTSALSVPPDRLDFGQAWESSRFAWDLPIENRGRQDVAVEEFSTSCNCTKVEPASLLIPAGETRQVRLTLDLIAGARLGPPGAEGREFSVGISPKLRGEETPAAGNRWLVQGKVRPLLHVDRPAVDFGRRSEFSSVFQPQLIVVSSLAPLRGLTVTSEPPLLPVVVERASDKPEEFALTICLLPGLPVGPIQQEILLVAELDSGERAVRALQVAGRILNDYQASPSEVLLGARLVGEDAEESVTLHSLTRRPVVLVGTTVEGDGLSVDEVPFRGGEGPTFRLRQRVQKAGEQRGKVVFRVRAAGKVAEIVVPVSYLGLNL